MVHEVTSFGPFIQSWLTISLSLSLSHQVDNMKLTYNITDRKTYNTPGVETVVPGFGTTDTIENLSDWNSIFFSYTQYFYHIVENMVTQLNYTRNVDVVGAPYDFRKAPSESTEGRPGNGGTGREGRRD